MYYKNMYYQLEKYELHTENTTHVLYGITHVKHMCHIS